MDIAAMSIDLNLAQVQNTAAVLTLKKTMDTAEAQMQAMVEMMQQVSPPSFGHSLDIRA